MNGMENATAAKKSEPMDIHRKSMSRKCVFLQDPLKTWLNIHNHINQENSLLLELFDIDLDSEHPLR